MKRVKFYFKLLWKPVLLTVVMLVASLVLVLAEPDKVPGGYSHEEVNYFAYVNKSGLLPDNPVNLPVFVVHKISLYINNQISTLRTVNALLGICAVVLMFFVVKNWQTTRIAVMTCVLYITATWFLITTRNATPVVGLLFSVIIPLLVIWNQITTKHKFALVITALVIGMLLYLPGMIWFFLAGLIWKAKSIYKLLRYSPSWNVIAAISVFIIILIPFALNITDMNFISSISGINFSDFSIVAYTKNLAIFPVNLFLNSGFHNSSNLGGQAIFDVFVSVLIVAGTINIIKKWRKSRSRFILVTLLISYLLIGLGPNIPYAITLPFFILLISNGLSWLLQQWLTVFPRNPLAQNTGIALIVAAIAMSSIYNVYRFYVAWPHMNSTKTIYTIQQ
ncbi:MAG: hypothetical protein U0451_02125 [Candidatus Saccharimonadales bacterium]